MENQNQEISKPRFILGSIIFISGFAIPLLIPLVVNSNLSNSWKTGLSGFLALGIPEIFMIIAVAIMGKAGLTFLKSKLFSFLKPLAPPDVVSTTRYRIGLFMFLLPLTAGWVTPYLAHFFPSLNSIPLYYFAVADVIFFASFFVLGGNFWDKFRNLFSNK